MTTQETYVAILTELHKPLIIDNVTLPEQLDYGQVLVKVYYSCICGSQLGEIDGVKGKDRFLPHLLGHEGQELLRQLDLAFQRLNPVITLCRPGLKAEAPMFHLLCIERPMVQSLTLALSLRL